MSWNGNDNPRFETPRETETGLLISISRHAERSNSNDDGEINLRSLPIFIRFEGVEEYHVEIETFWRWKRASGVLSPQQKK